MAKRIDKAGPDTVQRYDRGRLRAPQRRADGRLIVEGHLTRSGVFEYLKPDGSVVREYRPPEEVFDPESMASLALVPVTDDHPVDMLTARNARDFAVGTVGEGIRQDGTYLTGTLVFIDERVIEKMERQGKVELSCGYECAIDRTPGITPSGERYDVVQRKIRYNHVALVDKGRAGPDARVRMDAAVQTQPRSDDMDPDELKKKLDAATAENAKLQTRIDDMQAKLDAKYKDDEDEEEDDEDDKKKKKVPPFLKKKMDELQAKLDDAEAKVKKLEGERTDAAQRFDARIKERVQLLNTADRIIGSTDDDGNRIDRSDLSDHDIKIAVIQHVRGKDVKLDGKSADYVQARFDAAVEDAGDSANALGEARIAAELGNGKKPGASRNDAASARAKMIQDNQTAWMNKSS